MSNCLVAHNVWSGAGKSALQSKDPNDAVTYLSDESRMQGRAEKIFFPRSEDDIITILFAAKSDRKTVTISGGRTGITGGAVPDGGWLISKERMGRVLGNFTL